MSGPDSTTPLVCSATLQILPLRFEPLGFFFFFPLLLTVFIYVPLKKLCLVVLIEFMTRMTSFHPH